MVSPRVEFGRANLAANMITLMRHLGMDAYQIPLTPYLTAAQINQLNTLTLTDLGAHPAIEARREIERVLAVVEPAFTVGARRIHFAGNLLEVMLSVRRWNEEIAQAEYRTQWGKRTISYFVFDAHSGLFAPAKFCAYVPVEAAVHTASLMLSIQLYTTLDANEKVFDGHRAHTHLTRHLAMQLLAGDAIGDLRLRFAQWFALHQDTIAVHSRGPGILIAPPWFSKKQ